MKISSGTATAPSGPWRRWTAVMLRNWNRTVRPEDLVCFLGDMSFGRSSRSPKWWLKRLNGRIIYIKGSHDRGIRPSSVLPKVLSISNFEYAGIDGLSLLLVHDPLSAAVNGWDDWIIYGHNHNNSPFLDPQKKRVNVSVESRITGLSVSPRSSST